MEAASVAGGIACAGSGFPDGPHPKAMVMDAQIGKRVRVFIPTPYRISVHENKGHQPHHASRKLAEIVNQTYSQVL
jgi:hypothetical protein